MKKRVSFFDHIQPNPSVKEIWFQLFSNLMATLVPFVFIAPVSGTIVCAFLTLVSLSFHFLRWRIYGPLTYIFTLVIVIALRTTLPRGAFSGEFFAIFFAVMAILKSCNLRTYGDGVIFLILVLGANSSLFLIDSDSSVSIVIWTFAATLWTLGNLLRINLKNFSSPALLASLKSAAYATLYTLPLLFFLFYIFQKFSHVNFYYDRGDAMTGLSRSLEPGGISRLSKNSNIALRVKLEDDEVPFRDLYWRGYVLSRSKGMTWKVLKNAKEMESRVPPMALINKRCILEQKIYSQSNSLSGLKMALDKPMPESFLGTNPYTVSSYTCGPVTDKTLPLKAPPHTYLEVEGPISPQIFQLVGFLSKGTPNKETYLRNILKYFKTENFKYSLNPKITNSRMPLDDFLFKSHEGFCDHFAAAFATLARLGGVPSRIITGFQGGTYNRFGHFWTVGYKDAHAWVEVWRPHQGWVRMDPTAIVAPERINMGASAIGHKKGFLSDEFEIDTLWMVTDAFFFWIRGLFDHRDTLMSLDDLTFNPFHIGALVFVFLCWFQARRLTQDYNLAVNKQFKKLTVLLNRRALARGRSEGFESYRLRLLKWLEGQKNLRPLGPTVDRVFKRFIEFRYSGAGLPPRDLHDLYSEIKTLQRALKIKTHFIVGLLNKNQNP